MGKVAEVLDEIVASAQNVREAKQQGRVKVPPPVSPKGYQGFLIVHTKKAAIGLGYEHGVGMAIRVLGMHPDGSPLLSAPVVVSIKKASIGLAMGINTVYQVLLFEDSELLEKLISSPEAIMGPEFEVAGLANVTKPDTSEQDANKHKVYMSAIQGGVRIHPISLSVSDSLMLVDASLYGGTLSTDWDLMREVYGGQTPSALDCLRGQVPVPLAAAATMLELGKSLVGIFSQ
ncbi:hypothetical protein HYH02_010842 [Chlamydomonas schloesseri]|uniref:Ysc84 actin-binding domain-containing protein n=1 Tax=Chlamydomonas schloesseri TaxID=2026947 RepID=A0A835W2Q3_9CHLO|nr:hypothetical protein HYH02_010842 [Chlamydomonas schloesseri]|eukprot:KAG2438387.1 hypothetical protein HYH02_010842 [Chlamydomonas schloesseri]